MHTSTADIKTTKRARSRALTLVMAILTGVVAVGIPATSAFALSDVVITTYGLRNTPQAGVTVEIHKSSGDALAGTCTTAASGQCSVTGLTNNTSYYAKETAAASPYSAISQIWLGNSDGTGGVLTSYRKTFTTSNNGTGNVALFVRRDNPVFPDRCGLKVALVIDTSGSTSGSQPEIERRWQAYRVVFQMAEDQESV